MTAPLETQSARQKPGLSNFVVDEVSDAGGGSQRDSQSSMSSASPNGWKGTGFCHISLTVSRWGFPLYLLLYYFLHLPY